MVAPYFDLHDPDAVKKHLPIARLINMVYPGYRIKIDKKGVVFPHNEHFFADPLSKSLSITVHNIIQNSLLLERLHSHYISKFKHPLLLIECGLEKQVSNKAMRAFYDNYNNDDKTLLTYSDVGHDVHQDGDFWPTLVQDITDWQSNHL
jgi:alpha-beta hydrolase superfamily lysophospholipase